MNNLKRLLSHLTLYRWRSLLAVVGMVVVGVALARPSYAIWDLIGFTKDSALLLISFVLYFLLISVMGLLATIATKVLVYTAQLTNFTDLAVIVEAWSVVRDLANMFFIVILLVIAFGTLFRLEAYSWKKLLPKMVLAAVLMNYSRAICGFIVDASQVIMLTFVAAIKDAASVGLTSAFNLPELLKFGNTLEPEENVTTSSQQRLLAIVAAGFMLATMFTVQCVYIVVLVGRLVMIWFLTVLSPLAYVSRVLPATERYASQWWEMFGRYVTVGPMCMFFLWLAMFIAAKSIPEGGLGGSFAASEEVAAAEAVDPAIAQSGALDTSLIAGFVIATMMLMAGMKLAQQNASELGEATGKVSGLAKGLTKLVGVGVAAKGLSYLNDRQAMKTGYDLNLPRVYKNWKHGDETNKRRRENQIAATAGSRYREGDLLAGALGAGDQVIETGITPDQFRGGVLGNIPLVGTALSKRGWGLNKESKFRAALKEEGEAEGVQTLAEQNLTTVRSGLGEGLQTNQEFDNEQNELDKSRDAAATISGDYTLDSKMEFDATEKGAHRSMIEMRISNLQGTLSDPALSDAQKLANSKEITGLQQGLGKKFKQADIGVNMADTVSEHFTKIQKEANDHAAKRKTATYDGKFHTQADIENFLDKDSGVMAATSAAKDAKAASTAAHDKRHRLGPKMGSGWEIKFRAAVNEEAGKIKTTDADTLRDMFIEAVETNKSVEMAAIYEKLCETGNDNEAYKAFGLKFNAGKNGAQALAKIMQKSGLSEQATLSTMNRGAQLSEAVGHTPVTQMFDTKSGVIAWRSAEKQRAYAKGEEAKKDQKSHQIRSTRLSVGELSETYDAEDAENERVFVERRLLNILGTSKTDKTSETNKDFLKGTMRNAQRWKDYQAEIKRLLRDKAPEAVQRLKDECARNGIRIAE